MKTVEYKAWLIEFNNLVEKYRSTIDWETFFFDWDDFGAIGDGLQLDAYLNVYFDINNKDDNEFVHNPSIYMWPFYDLSCCDRTDFQMNLKNDWEDQLDVINNE